MISEPNESPVKAVRWIGRVAVVDVAGEIDLACSTRFQKSLKAVLEKGPDRLVINLAGVTYMDSSGVASLVKLLSRARKMGMQLRLAHMNDRVGSVFEITRLNTVFDIYETEQEALNSQ